MHNFVIPTALVTLMACTATWADLAQHIVSKGEIVAAIMPNYPPMSFKDPSTNTLAGVDYDLGNALAERLGVKIKWTETAFEQMLSALATQRVDIVLSGMTDTTERQKSVIFVDYFSSGPQFFTLHSNDQLNDISDLCGKTVGASRRTTFPIEVAEWSAINCEAAGRPAVKVVGSEGSADARAQLRQGRLDAALQGSETLGYLQSQEKDAYKPLGTPISAQLTGLAVNKNNPELANAIKHALQSMIEDGSYQAILKKWDLSQSAIETVTINQGQ